MAQSAILEAEMAPFFTTKAPFQFPANFREGFVKYWPIVSLVLLVLSVPGILVFLGIGSLGASAAIMAGAGIAFTISMILAIVGLVLTVLALPGLFNRKRSGWVFSYYAQLISIVSGILSLNIIGIIFGLLFLMLLFQVREHYT